MIFLFFTDSLISQSLTGLELFNDQFDNDNLLINF